MSFLLVENAFFWVFMVTRSPAGENEDFVVWVGIHILSKKNGAKILLFLQVLR
jgi:hypothetical protein